ncbi:MAG TPA: hypothetical protein VHP34_04850 [Alphaproteobacteria bacterium]|nr:hypothetical protein [Alphaproteobacteria bacterium]
MIAHGAMPHSLTRENIVTEFDDEKGAQRHKKTLFPLGGIILAVIGRHAGDKGHVVYHNKNIPILIPESQHFSPVPVRFMTFS